jgi:hypothetical protein
MNMLVTDSVSGFSDRLRMMISAHDLASRCGRSLLHIWQPTDACGASFRDLFQSESIEVSEDDPWPNIPTKDYQNTPWDIISSEVMNSTEEVAKLTCFTGTCDHNSKLGTLVRFADPVMEAAERFIGTQLKDSPAIVGCHVRMGDKQSEMQLPSVQDYWDAIDQSGGGVIFLATDEPMVRGLFVEHYAGRMRLYPTRGYARGTRKATIDSAVELAILRSCTAVVSGFYSGFSRFALYSNDTPPKPNRKIEVFKP